VQADADSTVATLTLANIILSQACKNELVQVSTIKYVVEMEKERTEERGPILEISA
jgi:hypothetical protein